jgi:sulfhydrogenase subunit beta (sulfur reductase)
MKEQPMLERTFTKPGFDAGLRELRESYRILVPVKEGDFHVFRPLDEGKEADFSYQNTRLSPKGVVYPQSERMFDVKLDEKDPEGNLYRESRKDYSPRAVVGIRPCDAHGFQIVKRNFDNEAYRDPWWVKGFESTTLVGLGCNEPCGTCFCASVGGGPFAEEGLDALLVDVGESFLARGITAKGEAFLDGLEGGEAAGEGVKAKAEALKKSAGEKFSKKVPVDQLKSKVINELFSAPFWDEVSFACLNCGTCTFLCPTCWCFDIQDEVMGKEGERMRNWDSCMFPLFTLHGSGHNPREKKLERVRQRFMHKLKYYVDKYGAGVQCSGCGRCVRYCPVNIDIREIAERMNSF